MIKEQIVIDTRPESGWQFVADESVSDYTTWLISRYEACRVRDGESHYFFGIGQMINAYIFKAKRQGASLIAKGPHASEAAQAIEKISDQSVTVTVDHPSLL